MYSYPQNQLAPTERLHEVVIQAVVVSITHDYWILVQENKDPYQESFFWMSQLSTNIRSSTHFPRMREYVTIREVVEVNSTNTPSFFVKTFEYTPHPNRVYKKKEVMAVAKVKKCYIVLVGKSLKTETYVCIPYDTSGFSVGQLVIGDIIELPLYVDVYWPNAMNDEVMHYKKNYENMKQGTSCPNPVMYPENVRPLTSEEEEKVFKRCANVPNIELPEAQRFVQEPLIASGLLENYLKNQGIMKYLFSARDVKLGIDRELPYLSFYMDVPTYQHLFQFVSNSLSLKFMIFKTQSVLTWRVGAETSVVNRLLKFNGKEKEAHMIIRNVVFRQNSYRVELVSTGRSRNLLRAAFRHPDAFLGETFRISPSFDKRDTTVESLIANFDEFFLERRHLFDLCTGRVENPVEVEIVDREKPFYVNGNPLDASQLEFMKNAASIPGFTCAQAPPGCGKTHTTSALVSYLKEIRVKGGICISGTTNAAVTNAADAVAERFPDIRITREYSMKAEANISKASYKASLRQMTEEAEKYVDLDSHWWLKDNLEAMKEARKELDDKAPSIKQQLAKVKNAEILEKNTVTSFVDAYDIHVYATTVELLIRRGDIFQGYGYDDGDEDRSLRRLILDEAAQMSPLEAMALYCTFPHLEYITLLGDMKQLGPHSSLPEGSTCFKLISEGELTRMFKLPSTKKNELNMIYRCHPSITDKMLLPIYGPQLKSGITAASRSLAEDKGLQVAEDGSPCVFINVEGREDKGINKTEMQTAIRMIFDIVDIKGVPADDVVVICYHRAQLNGLNQELKGLGHFGPLYTKVAIHTVDSFQGKEAKVVILLTTKTCKFNDDGEGRMKFVGNPARGTVAVSRAQHALYILGHWQSLMKTEFWNQLLGDMNTSEAIVNTELVELVSNVILTQKKEMAASEAIVNVQSTSTNVVTAETKKKKKRNRREKQENKYRSKWSSDDSDSAIRLSTSPGLL